MIGVEWGASLFQAGGETGEEYTACKEGPCAPQHVAGTRLVPTCPLIHAGQRWIAGRPARKRSML